MKKHSNLPAQQGYSLLEVMITIVIASFALLALAGMLVKGIQHNNSSYLRSIAIQQAYDLSDRMRANPDKSSPPLGFYDAIAFDSAETCGTCTAGSTCSPTELAAYDACSWNKQNRALLPFGQGTVTRSVKAYTITVAWDDTREGDVAAKLKKFVLKVEP